MALTKKQQEALRRNLKPYAACARKIGILPGRKWTKAQKRGSSSVRQEDEAHEIAD